MRKSIVLVFILIGNLFPQTADEQINQLQDRFRSLKDFQADFNQISENPRFNISRSLSGTFYYKSGNKFLIDLNGIKIISNGNTIWNYDEKQKRTVVNNLSDDTDMFFLENIIFDYPSLCEVSIDEEDPKNIIFIPRSNELNFGRAIITLNKDKLLSRIRIVDISRTEIIFEFSNYKLNTNLSDDFFEFKIPGDSKVIDFR